MKRLIPALPIAVAAAASCGGLVGGDVDAAANGDAFVDGPYEGQWCDLDAGPLATPINDASRFCGIHPYRPDVWTYCEFNPGIGFSCCAQDDFECCPGLLDTLKYGHGQNCCNFATQDCSACCNGVYPGSYFTKDAH